MKRYICLLLCVLLIAGCGLNGKKHAKIAVLDKNDYWYTAKIDEDVSPPYPLTDGYTVFIQVPVQTIREGAESWLEENGYSKDLAARIQLEGNEYNTITTRISLPMKSKTPNEAREVGAVATALVKTFYEDYADTILYALNVFNKNPSVTQTVRTVICGNTKFEYTASSGSERLLLTPYDITPSTDYAPVKPN